MTAPVEPFDVFGVGGGPAGRPAAWYLRERGLRFLVLEAAAELGHAWRTRWESLRLFTPARWPPRRLASAGRTAVPAGRPRPRSRRKRTGRPGRGWRVMCPSTDHVGGSSDGLTYAASTAG